MAIIVHAMPAQVMIIRHAEKFEDREKIHLNTQGYTRAKALAQFFQTDPRVMQYGVVAAIIAQRATKERKAVRCIETVEPLAQALGQKVIDRFGKGEIMEMAEWLRASREWDSRSVLVCMAHLDIVPFVKALGVSQVGQPVWPHETYDRVWIINFSQTDKKVTSFRDIPQRLLFGDSFQTDVSSGQPGTFSFSQTYRETLRMAATKNIPAIIWKSCIIAEVQGDFSQFDDDTIPVLRLGGFTFGYYATTLGKLRKNKNAEVRTDAAAGSGSMLYNYKTTVDGVEKTYASVRFAWGKNRLRAEFQADVDESRITPDLNMPVECRLEQAEGVINGSIDSYLGFGNKRFYAPAGLSYRGIATKSRDKSNSETYQVDLKDNNGFIIKKLYLPEL